jgi:hypothetical protein
VFHSGTDLHATRRKVAGLRPDEVNNFYVSQILPAALGPGIYSASNKCIPEEEIKQFLRSRARPMREANNLTVVYEPIV